MLVTLCIPFPFSTPCVDMLAMLVCATRWLYMHLHTLAYISMHESCLLVCRPCFNITKLWTSDPNLHLSLVDITLRKKIFAEKSEKWSWNGQKKSLEAFYCCSYGRVVPRIFKGMTNAPSGVGRQRWLGQCWPVEQLTQKKKKEKKKEFLLGAKVLDPRKRFLDPLQLLNLIRVRPVLTHKWCYFTHAI